MKELNGDEEIRPGLDFHPFKPKDLKLEILFEDESDGDFLSNGGVAVTSLKNGKITYEKHEKINKLCEMKPISESLFHVTETFSPFTDLQEESFEEAYKIAEEQNAIQNWLD